jgi:hypothetical protein
MRYSDIDVVLLPWAASRSLHIYTRHQDEEVRIMSIVDDSGDSYQLYAGPDPKDPKYPDSKHAVIGVSLSKRGNKNHHAFHRERLRFTFEQSVSLLQVSDSLDAAWQRVHDWIVEAGHTRTPA